MFRKSMFRFGPPRFVYQPLEGITATPMAAAPRRMVLFCDCPLTRNDRLQLSPGDRVRTGDRLCPVAGQEAYVISTATGTVAAVEPFVGDFARRWTRIVIDVAEAEDAAPDFAAAAEDVSAATVEAWLAAAPGALPVKDLCRPPKPIDTVVVTAAETDLLSVSAQWVLRHRIDDVKAGIDHLHTLTGARRVVLAVPRDTVQGMGHVHADLGAIPPVYPAGAPALMLADLLPREIPAGTAPSQLGILVVPVEAAAALGEAFTRRRLPLEKTVTVIDKEGGMHLTTVRVGTPLGDICAAFDIQLADRDRLILGGPMTGVAVFGEDYPIRPDTDALMIQDADAISPYSDYPCINCGECVRICPTRVPVNMLVRLLEAGQYQEAVDQYDLLSCIDCGLCTYVCSARIPISQYIRLAKHELALSATVEAEDA